MLRLLADENFDGAIVRGLLRRRPDLDIVRVQDVGLAGMDDPLILEWAAEAGRILLTHDVRTVTRFAYERLSAGRPLPGIIEIAHSVSIGAAIEDILLIAECGTPADVENQIIYLPLR